MHLAGKFLSCLHHLAAEIEPAVLKFAPDEFSVRDTVLYHQHRQLLAFGVELLRFGLNYQFARNHELCPAARAVLPASRLLRNEPVPPELLDRLANLFE